jgi:hypothetical protein
MIKYFLFFYLSFYIFSANADSVHLGLRISYKTGMSHVQKKDRSIITTLYKVSQTLPDSKFLISGHTDIVGSYEVNFELSKGRAEILKNLLVADGMSAGRIETKWFSYDAPISSNDTEEGRAKNRRVVATVYGLTAIQAKKLADSASKSSRFYVISVENEQVDNYIKNLLSEEVKVSPPEKSQAEIDAEQKRLKGLADKEERLRLANLEIEKENKRKQELLQKKQNEELALKRALKWKAFKEKQRYYLAWEVSDNQLKAESTGFEAIWVTDFNHALSAAYQYKMSSNFWVGLQGAYKFRSYRTDNNLIYSWDGKTPNLLSYSVIADYQMSSVWNFGFDLKYFEENFIIYNGLNIDLVKASMFGVGFRADYKIINAASFNSRLKFMIDHPISGSGAIDPSGGLSLYGGIDVSLLKLFKNHDINLGLIYGLRNFENIQNKQNENYFGLEIKIRNKKWF